MDVKIRTEWTPNPNALKFVTNQNVKTAGKISYTRPEECQHVPLSHGLLSVPHVTQAHFFENVVTVTQDGAADWEILKDQITYVILKQLPLHNPDFDEKRLDPRANLPPDLQKIEEILDRTVRKGLQMDGGDLEVVSLDGKKLTVKYQGACGGCPSSSAGTLRAIQGILRDEYDPELEVTTI